MNYSTDPTTSINISPVFYIIFLALLVFYIAAEWRIFSKAGQPGWAVIIPIYNTLVALKIVGRPWWWIFLFVIPVVDIVVAIVVWYDLSKSFGHRAAFTVGLVILSWIFLLILWLGPSSYRGPSVEPSAAA